MHRFVCRGLGVFIVLAPAGGARTVDAGVPADEQAAGPPARITDPPPIAQRLWSDLACVCGRCGRMPLSTCTCPEAAHQRDHVLGLLKGRDVSTPTRNGPPMRR